MVFFNSKTFLGQLIFLILVKHLLASAYLTSATRTFGLAYNDSTGHYLHPTEIGFMVSGTEKKLQFNIFTYPAEKFHSAYSSYMVKA